MKTFKKGKVYRLDIAKKVRDMNSILYDNQPNKYSYTIPFVWKTQAQYLKYNEFVAGNNGTFIALPCKDGTKLHVSADWCIEK